MDINAIPKALERNKEQQTIKEEALAKNECPECAWPLKRRGDGSASCPCCGEIFG